MEHPEKRYYKWNRVLLLATGLWPYQNVWVARLARGIFTVLDLSVLIIQLIIMFDITEEFLMMLLELFGSTLLIVQHMYVSIGHLDKYKELFKRIWQDWALQKTDDEIRIMHQHAEITRFMTLYYILFVSGVQFLYHIWMFIPEILDVILPMNESRPRNKLFNYDFNILFDEERDFYLIQFCVITMIIYVPLVFYATLALFLAFVQHVCAMYELLGHRAERLFYIESAAESDYNDETRIRYGKMANFVRLHCNIIQFINTIKSCYTVLILTDMAAFMFRLTAMLTELSNNAGNVEVTIRCVSFSVALLCYLFIFNYMGQRITDMSLDIYENLYNSVWYNADVLEQNSLLIIMRQNVHPIVITAGKFCVLSLESFGTILQMAVFYYVP